MLKRSRYISSISHNDVSKYIIINGWVHRIRELGGLTFINVRDRSGIIQCVCSDESSDYIKERVGDLKMEYSVAIGGVLRLRDEALVNKDMATGEFEIEIKDIEIFSKCKTLPFTINEGSTQAKEDLRLKYRYLDLRSGKMQKNIAFRSRFISAIRAFLDTKNFLEIETPTLIRSTPEGARDFLVPSRLYPGKFYSLPQSPQLYKQLLMVSGFDRYYQIARCYRDEDARGDRQLEFTQLDLEMSFVERDDVLKLMEQLFRDVFAKVVHYTLPRSFKRLSYADAMNIYGCDKPDLRYELLIQDFAEELSLSSFDALKKIVDEGGYAKAIVLPVREAGENGELTPYSRKEIEEILDTAKKFKNKSSFFLKCEKAEGEDERLVLSGSAAKFFEPELQQQIIEKFSLKAHDVLCIVADDNWKKVCNQAGEIRRQIAAKLGLDQSKEFIFCWIIDFPLFSFNEETNSWEAEHHMFSRPSKDTIKYLDTDPGKVLGDLYDLVLNGYEVASGSVRINEPELQEKIFEICSYSKERAQKAFGFLMEAFEYGAPPHAGIAPGLDRICMIVQGETSIKDVIAFPKNTFAVSPMDDAPSEVSQEQLDELHLEIKGSSEDF